MVNHKKTIDFLDELLHAENIIKIGSDFDISYFKSGGGTHLYLIKTNNQKYLARVNYYKLKNKWKIKKHEHSVLKLLAGYGIAPKVFYFNDKNKLNQHFTIVEYIEGRPIKKFRDIDIINLANILKKLHESIKFKRSGDYLPPDDKLPYHCDIFNEFANGEDKQLEKYNLPNIKKVIKQYNEVKSELGDWFNNLKIFEDCRDFSLCHADLKQENILANKNKVFLIDWECAGSDIPESDIGRLFSGCQFNQKQQKLFLAKYYKKKPDEIILQRIYSIKTILDFFRITEDYIILKRKRWNAEKMNSEIMKFKRNFKFTTFPTARNAVERR